jgi:hypothetical protein
MTMIRLVAGAVLFSVAATAQIVTGTVVGTITDASGGAVPRTAIVLTNTATGITRSVSSEPTGDYVFAQLPPGVYRLSATAEGFKKYDVSDITVLVDQTVRINVKLELGSVNQEVKVVAAAAQVESETSSLGQVIEHQQIVDLPLNGRNFMQLAYIGAGVTPAYDTRSAAVTAALGRNDLAVHISGGRGDANSYLIDGVETRSTFYNTPSVLLSVDAVQEFKVERNLFSAEYGQGSGIISVVSKSGTNSLHGSAYEFLRNDKFDAANFFDNFFGNRKAPFRQNQYGVTAGGAVIRNKLFFFGDWEALRSRKSATSSALVPTAAQLGGSLAGLISSKRDPATNALAIIDPATGAPFPNNVIPTSRISGVTQKFEKYSPGPNTSVGSFNLVKTLSTNRNDDQWGVRVDYQISARDSLFGRYTDYDSFLYRPGLGPYSGNVYPYGGRNTVVQETHIFSPRLLSVFKFGFTHAPASLSWESTPDNAAQNLGLKLNVPSDFYGLPNVTLSNGYFVGGGAIGKSGGIDNLAQFTDTVTWSRGRHGIRFGADVRLIRWDFRGGTSTNGSFNFDGRYTGNAVSDFLLGYPASSTAQLGVGAIFLRSHSYNFFVGDDFKVSPRLTLNFGLRYEYGSPYADKDHHEGYFDTSLGKYVVGISRQESSIQRDIPNLVFNPDLRRGVYYPDRNDFAPRFGFAYRVADATVVRGGYGIFYSKTQGNELTFLSNAPPLLFTSTLVGSLTTPNVSWDRDTFPDPSSPAFPLSTLSPYSVDPRDRDPYMQQWNLGIERSLSANLLLEVAYAGSKGTKLDERVNINQAVLPAAVNPLPLAARRPYPDIGDIISSNLQENSIYNALQTRLEKRFGGGFSFLAGYTWSHSIDTASRGRGGSWHQDARNLRADRGSSDFDVRHRLTASYVYQLPFGRGRRYLANAGPVWNRIVGGWGINGISSFMTGNYYSITVTGDRANVGGFPFQRANRSCDGNLGRDQRSVSKYFDSSCFSLTPPGTFGNAGRNIVAIPGINNWDMSAVKETALNERVRTQFRAEFFNIINHSQFGLPITAVDNRLFGQIQTARDPRQIQLGLKVLW